MAHGKPCVQVEELHLTINRLRRTIIRSKGFLFNEGGASMAIRMDKVLYKFAHFYVEKLLTDYPHMRSEEIVDRNVLIVTALRAFEANGYAIQGSDRNRDVIWRATPKFLESTGLEAGPLVHLGASLN
jgi:hypothetical protein